MRIVMVAHSFPRFVGDVAGSFLLRLAESLVTRGHVVAVVAPSDHGKGGRLTLGSVDVLQVRYARAAREDLAYTGDMSRSARSPSGALAFVNLVRALRRGAREEAARIGAEVVHALWWVPGGWAVAGEGLPSVVSLMGTDVTMMRSLPGRLLARRVLPKARQLTALTGFLADEARAHTGLRDLAVHRVPMPVDIDRFNRPPAARGEGIVYLGRLSAQKRVDLLLDAVHAAGITAKVTIIGDGPERAALEAQAHRLGLGNVAFAGLVPDDAVPGMVGGAAVAAFPAVREGLGLAAAEALMLGTPVIAMTDGGGVLDLVSDGDGSRVVSPTPQAVGQALAQCLADTAMRGRAAQAGQRLRERLSPDGVAQQFEQVYALATRTTTGS